MTTHTAPYSPETRPPVETGRRLATFPRNRGAEELRTKEIGVQVHYVPIYQHPLYGDLGVRPADFPVTEAVYQQLISLPLYPALTVDQQDRVIDAVEAVV